jgi:signal transduction histidine kinase
MKIKDRLSIQFTVIFAVILAVVFVVIYWITAHNRKYTFYSRLKDRALTTAEIFLAQDNFSKEKFSEVQKKYPQQLPLEVVDIYDKNDHPAFIKERVVFWNKAILRKVRQDEYLQYQTGKRQVTGVYYHDNSGNFVVMASAIDEYGYRQLQQLCWILVTIFCITLILVFFTSRIFAQTALLPIDKVIKQLKLIGVTNLHKRVDEGGGKDEISELAIHFNHLLQRLEDAFDLQRSFVASASHELRTPVTSIIGEIEVVLNKQRTSEEYSQALHSILAEAGRLKEITNSLLELAQIDFDFSRIPMEEVRMDELIWELREEWMAKTGNRLLEVEMDHLPDDEKMLIVHGNRHLLNIAVNNVVTNAFKFSNFNSKVICRLERTPSNIMVSVTDYGIGIDKSDIDKILQPFYRGHNARGFSGHGIGLYFTDNIIQLHKGNIQVHSILSEQTRFIITLPSGFN